MPIYKRNPRETKKPKDLPFYRPIDRLIMRFWEMRQKALPFLLASLFLVALYGAFRAYAHVYDSKAAALLEKRSLTDVIQKYPRSSSAALAGLELGFTALKDKKYDDAIRWYGEIAEQRSAPAIFRVTARQNLGLAFLKKGETDQAINTLEKSSEDPENVLSDYSKLLMARAYEVKGDAEKARGIYKDLSEAASHVSIKEEAKERLSWVDAKK